MRNVGAGIVHSVKRLATGWTAEGPELKSHEGRDFSLLYVVQNDFGAHPTSYPKGKGEYLSGGKAAGA
jgi:hypothetical protein